MHRVFRAVGAWALCLALVLAAGGAAASDRVLVVGNDRGGEIAPRAERVRGLRARHTRVEIRGAVCLSSCTMYLGAGDVCVSPATRFGFHGPSNRGRPLPPDRFDHWSRVIAAHYPRPVKGWFLQKARFRQRGYYTVTGARLIELGVPACG